MNRVAHYNALFTAILIAANAARLLAKIARWAFALQLVALAGLFMASGESLSLSVLPMAPIKGFIFALSAEKLLPRAAEYLCKAIAASARKRQDRHA